MRSGLMLACLIALFSFSSCNGKGSRGGGRHETSGDPSGSSFDGTPAGEPSGDETQSDGNATDPSGDATDPSNDANQADGAMDNGGLDEPGFEDDFDDNSDDGF